MTMKLEKYRITDAAHESRSFFQVFNEVVFTKNRDSVTPLYNGEEHKFIHLQVTAVHDPR